MLIIVIMVLSMVFVLWDMRARELAHSRQETLNLTEMLVDQTKQNFDNADLVLKGVQERLQNTFGRQFALSSLQTHLLLGTRVASVRQMTSLFIVDAKGMVVNSSRENHQPFSVADRDYFKAFSEGATQGLFVANPARNRVDGGWTLFLARRLNTLDGKFMGLVVAAMNIQKLEQHYTIVKMDLARPLSIYLLDGTLIASQPHRESLMATHAPELTNEPTPAPDDPVRITSHARGDGGRQAFALGRVPQYPLMVSVTDDEEATLASWRETAIPIAMGAALVCLFIAISAGLLVSQLRHEELLTQSLMEANDRYHLTVDSLMDAIVAVDEEQKIMFFNPAAEKMFGLTAAQVMGTPLQRLIPKKLRGAHQIHVDRYIESNESSRGMGSQLDIAGLRSDGTEFPIESTISKMTIDGKRQFTAVLRDVTDRRRAETNMREMNRQLRALTVALQEVREQERTRISRELHDDLGQQLTGLKLDLAWMTKRVKEGRELQPEAMDEMRRQLDEAIASVRRISTDLRPPILDDLGFGEAVTWHANEVAKRSGLEMKLNLEAASLVRNKDLATALFRIVQESLTNCVRHANAARVDIELLTNEKYLILKVQDNGQGFEMEKLLGGGIGLVSMRERIDALGGQLHISSSPGNGTTVLVKISLDQTAIAGELA
jgi:PAS domain S-box-containing protein